MDERGAEKRFRAANEIGAPAVVIDGLRHVYGSREALAGITLTVQRQEMFALLGPNGGAKRPCFGFCRR